MGAVFLLGVSLLAVFMACIGVYGMVSYTVARRTREMGIRLALGARGRAVVGIGVGGYDPMALAAAPAILLMIAAPAAWLPPRRAARVDPVEALRSE